MEWCAKDDPASGLTPVPCDVRSCVAFLRGFGTCEQVRPGRLDFGYGRVSYTPDA